MNKYGDVYLETLGMSCPATVKQVIGLTKPVCFPDSIYYEENDIIGTILEMSENEADARNTISHFAQGTDVIDTYLELIKETDPNSAIRSCSKGEILNILVSSAAGTPSERYANGLYTEQYIASKGSEHIAGDDDLQRIGKELDSDCELFSCNVNRMLMFEHIMLESQKDNPDKRSVLARGLITWYLLLMAFECRMVNKDHYDEEDMIYCTYRLMRMIDHGGKLLDPILKMMII